MIISKMPAIEIVNMKDGDHLFIDDMSFTDVLLIEDIIRMMEEKKIASFFVKKSPDDSCMDIVRLGMGSGGVRVINRDYRRIVNDRIKSLLSNGDKMYESLVIHKSKYKKVSFDLINEVVDLMIVNGDIVRDGKFLQIIK